MKWFALPLVFVITIAYFSSLGFLTFFNPLQMTIAKLFGAFLVFAILFTTVDED